MRASLAPLVGTLSRAGWRWAPLLKEVVGEVLHGSPIAGLEAWRGLPQWEDDQAPDKPGSLPVDIGEARQRLAEQKESGKTVPDVIVMGDPEWRPGLLGLVANSIAEEPLTVLLRRRDMFRAL